MHKPRPSRLPGFSYKGKYAYSLRFTTANQAPVFTRAATADVAIEQIQKTAADESFAVLAYCVMPDHVHLVVQGRTDGADLRRFVKLTKQRVEYVLRRRFLVYPLWQHGYFDRILRTGESLSLTIDYVLNNPVAAGLVRNPRDYPFSGGTFASKQDATS